MVIRPVHQIRMLCSVVFKVGVVVQSQNGIFRTNVAVHCSQTKGVMGRNDWKVTWQYVRTGLLKISCVRESMRDLG